MSEINIETKYLLKTLDELLQIASPTGFTDDIVHYVSNKLDELGVKYEITRRGAIRAHLKGRPKVRTGQLLRTWIQLAAWSGSSNTMAGFPLYQLATGPVGLRREPESRFSQMTDDSTGGPFFL
jgi:hypothetical protein